MEQSITSLITWTTYGTWLPGDNRGWRKRSGGHQTAEPLLEKWCRLKMKSDAVLLRVCDRNTVINACHEHCDYRGWDLLAVDARTNHVHVVVDAFEAPKTVRDQLKANCTRALRQQPDDLTTDPTWTGGGDCEILRTDDSIEAAVLYVKEAQDRQHLNDMESELFENDFIDLT